MIDTIARALDKPAIVQSLPEQPGDVRQTFAALDRATLELGYRPQTAFHAGVGRYIAWYRAQSFRPR
jgi:UDP-glucuronate 4-epimerase